jgi:hypothetical protein
MRAGSIAAFIAATTNHQAMAHHVAMQLHPLGACIAGRDSIGNAALLRSNGITREPFRSGLADNLVAIRGFPPQLRWLERNEINDAPLASALPGCPMRYIVSPTPNPMR